MDRCRRDVQTIHDGERVERRCAARRFQRAIRETENLVIPKHLVLHDVAVRADRAHARGIRAGRIPIELVQRKIEMRAERADIVGIERKRTGERRFRLRHQVFLLGMIVGVIEQRAPKRGKTLREIRRARCHLLKQRHRFCDALRRTRREFVLAFKILPIGFGIDGRRFSGQCGAGVPSNLLVKAEVIARAISSSSVRIPVISRSYVADQI